MGLYDYYPETQAQQPDVIGQYLRGAFAPGQLQQQQQQLTEGGLNIEQLRMSLQGTRDVAAGYQRMRDESLMQPSGGGSSGGAQNGPQAGVATQTAYTPGFSGRPNLTPSPSPATVGAISGLGVSPGMMQYLQGIAERGGDPVKSQNEMRESQLKSAQLQALQPGQPLPIYRAFAANPYAAQALTAPGNEQFLAQWPQFVQKYGLTPDPSTGSTLTNANVRRVAALEAQSIEGPREMPMTALPAEPVVNKKLGFGEVGQFDPVTGKKVGDVTERNPLQTETQQFIGPDGQPTLMTKAAGMAAGLKPYNAATYVNQPAADSVAHMIATYKMPPLTAQALRTQQGYETMQAVQKENPNYDATQYATKNKAREAFATGRQGDTVRSLSVATDHLDQLEKAATAMNNGDVQLANTIANTIGTQIGHPEVTNFNSIKEIVGDEVAKAVVGAKGGEGDREAIKAGFSSKGSPAQILGTIQQYRGLMGGQLNGLRQQYERSTGLTDFNDALSVNARAQIPGQGGGSGGAPSPRNAQGWVLHADAKGNQAYVSPDGKQFQEVH